MSVVTPRSFSQRRIVLAVNLRTVSEMRMCIRDISEYKQIKQLFDNLLGSDATVK